MNTHRGTNWILVLAGVCTALAPFFFWPFGVLGILLAVYARYPMLAVVFGVLLDVLYGTPPVQLHFLLFPFTLFAVCAAILRAVASQYILRRGRGDVL